MTFNSFEFLMIFLPATYVGFLMMHRIGGWNLGFAFLAMASTVFYGQFSWLLATILLTSASSNFIVGRLLTKLHNEKQANGALLTLAVAANLAALGYFKYSNFFIDSVNSAFGSEIANLDVILPVGISFYTFIQIGYLVEAAAGQVKNKSFVRYLVFSTFFPCVTAGPLVLQREIFGQMEGRRDRAFNPTRLVVGSTLFAIGLFKKVVLADTIGPFANIAFDGVAAGGSIDMMTAWMGTMAYTMQLYFDFSGYSDMAVGLGAIFGLKLPMNFNSPFKATSISDFWRRWHMTMTRFFTTYLYSPMAMKGMRKAVGKNYGPGRKWFATGAWPMVYTMILAGVWHGVGWTFAIYGLIHGLALAVNNGWTVFNMPKVPPILGWFATMAVVFTGLAVFRAEDVPTALVVLSAMWGVSTLFAQSAAAATPVVLDIMALLPLVAAFGIIIMVAPNSQEILRGSWVGTDDDRPALDAVKGFAARLVWNPGFAWAAATAVLFVIGFTSISDNGSFLYYKF